jgi:hypothetical protein
MCFTLQASIALNLFTRFSHLPSRTCVNRPQSFHEILALTFAYLRQPPSILSRDSRTYPRVFSSTAHVFRYPTFTLELAGQAQVSRVVLFLRQGSCGLRNMLGTGCGGINVNTNYNGQDQGFIVTVGNSPCQPETPCPGTVCQWVRRMTSNQQFVVPLSFFYFLLFSSVCKTVPRESERLLPCAPPHIPNFVGCPGVIDAAHRHHRHACPTHTLCDIEVLRLSFV